MSTIAILATVTLVVAAAYAIVIYLDPPTPPLPAPRRSGKPTVCTPVDGPVQGFTCRIPPDV